MRMFKMPQSYKKAGTRNHWTTDQLHKAKEAAKSGQLNTNKAAEKNHEVTPLRIFTSLNASKFSNKALRKFTLRLLCL